MTRTLVKNSPKPAPPAHPWDSHPVFISLLLAAITLGVYWPVIHFDFINYDDPDYVINNSHVQTGLTGTGFIWAFQTGYSFNWHPITWLSHMLDVQLFGMKAGWHHLTNLLFHAANTVLLFVLLRRLTGALWRSAVVAALFALHPLHVESVAWISERKDVLSTFFGILSLIFYARYAQRKTAGSQPSTLNYLLTLAFFAFSLMSKPMLVTLPFFMLLVDFWPLQRFGRSTINSQTFVLVHLFREKLPFFALSVISSMVTLFVQGGARTSWESYPFSARLANAVVSYARYLEKALWPGSLANPYPHPGIWPVWQVIFALVVVGGLCVVAILLARRRRHFFVGWFWFVGTLVPTIGLIQVGGQSMADRYTYFPLVGLFVLVVWMADEFVSRWHVPKVLVVGAAVLMVVAGAVRTRGQLNYWRNTETLFSHALEVTKGNAVAHNNLGYFALVNGYQEEAMSQLFTAIQINPNYCDAQNNLGTAFMMKGQVDDAVKHFKEAIRLRPSSFSGHNNLGVALQQNGRFEEAAEHFRTVLSLNPDHFQAQFNLALNFRLEGRHDEAVTRFKELLRLNPEDVRVIEQLHQLGEYIP